MQRCRKADAIGRYFQLLGRCFDFVAEELGWGVSFPFDFVPVHHYFLFATGVVALMGEVAFAGDQVESSIAIDIGHMKCVGL